MAGPDARIGWILSHCRSFEKMGECNVFGLPAQVTRINGSIALKFPPDVQDGDPRALTRFRREAWTASLPPGGSV